MLRRSVGILETPGITPGRILPWLDRHLNRLSIQCLYNSLHINYVPAIEKASNHYQYT